jgi:predicted RNA binding protein YcfA (HicA-like mRNA interferase family)
MKLPRAVSGDALAKALKALGYHITRQTGSHLRLTTVENGETTLPFRYTTRCASAHSPPFSMMWRRTSA